MRRIQLNSVQLNAVRLNGIGEYQRVSHAGAPPVVPDVPDIPDIPEEPDVPSAPDVDEDGYIIFADPEVKRVLLANGVGDGVGITKEVAAEVTSVGTWFKGNTLIQSFRELPMFVNAQAIPRSAFEGCANLQSINLTNVTALNINAFYNCTSLEIEDLQLPNLETLGKNAFYDVKIKKISNLGKLTAIPSGSSTTQTFGDKEILEEINIPSTVTALPKYCFGGYSNLKKVDGLEGVTTVDGYSFYEAKEISYLHFPSIVTFGITYSYYGVFSKAEDLNITLRLGSSCSTIAGLMFSYCKNCIVTLICDAVVPPELGVSIFHSASNSSFEAIYVPDGSVEDYKTATNWSTYADKILPLSQYNG